MVGLPRRALPRFSALTASSTAEFGVVVVQLRAAQPARLVVPAGGTECAVLPLWADKLHTR